MDEIERDRISKGFADLAGLFENAAAVAAEGQSGRRSLTSAKDGIEQIWTLLINCVAVLGELERCADGDRRKR